MTAVARRRMEGVPSLVGDVVLTRSGKRLHDGGGKVYVVAPNVALGWAGETGLAVIALRYLKYVLDGSAASFEDIEAAFARLDELRGKPGVGLDLTGWVVTSEAERGVRWSTDSREPLFDDGDDHAIGTGGAELLDWLRPAKISRRNTVGHDVAPMKVVNGLMIPRCEEMSRPEWPQSWGKAYDAILWQDATGFRWLDKLTYIRWNLVLDGEDRIADVKQAPVVFTQERVRDCTLMRTKAVSDIRPTTELSVPIYRSRMDLDWYFNQAYQVVSPYYANYFRVHCTSENSVMTLALASKNATPNGHVFHSGTDSSDPTFKLNVPRVEEEVRWALEEARRANFVNPAPA